MSLEDHRKPNGNYDGIGVMAELTGLARDEIRAIAAQVKANHTKLVGCPWHEFEVLITAPPGGGRYRCRHCQGEVDASAYHWHEQGRRPMPVGELQHAKVAVGYPCQGGPLDGKMRAEPPGCCNFPVSEWADKGVNSIRTAQYRLQQVGPDQLAWVFQGWPA